MVVINLFTLPHFVLQEKLAQLHKLDRKLQEISTQVSLLKEEKDKIESSMERLHKEMRRSWENPDRMMSLEEQQRDLKKELVKVRTQLAQGTKVSILSSRILMVVKWWVWRSDRENLKKKSVKVGLGLHMEEKYLYEVFNRNDKVFWSTC